MKQPVTTDQIVPMTDELEGKVEALIGLFGQDLFGVDWFKRTKKYINGKGNEATRKLLPGEEPDFRSALVSTKVKKFNKGGVAAYSFKKKRLVHVNLFNEVTRAQLDSHGAIGFNDVIELRHGGFVYHRNHGFEPIKAVGFVPNLLVA